MALHGPHQSAQKSVTTMREDCRTWAKCCGLVMLTVFDMVAGGGDEMIRGADEDEERGAGDANSVLGQM